MSEQVRPWVLRAAFLLALTAPFWSLGHPLVEVDDARYAEVPREMAAGGDWATPHLNGFDYVEKPPLWYWLCAASYKVFGVSEAAARFPLALLAVGGVAGAAWLGSWLYAPGVGLAAGAILGSTGLFFFLAHYITPDLGLTVWLLWCSGMILRALLRPDDARWAGPAAWVFAALGFLSKGLVALVFPGIWALALLAVYPKLRNRKALFGLFHPAGPLLFLGVAGPWFFVMERRHTGFFHFFFVEQHFQRFLTQKYNRASPWYFFLLVLPAGLLPWTSYALAGLWRGVKDFAAEPRDAALASWAVMILAFFSVSQSKLATYILPVFPQMALLTARGLQRPLPSWGRGLSLLLGAAAFAAGAAGILAASGYGGLLKLAGGFDATFLFATLALLALGEGLLVSGLAEKRAFAHLAFAGLFLGAISLLGLRQRADELSVKKLGTFIAQRRAPGEPVWAYGIFLHGIPFYLNASYDKIFEWTGELHYAKREAATAGRFGDDADLRALAEKPGKAFLVLRTFETPHVLSLIPAKRVASITTARRWTAIELN